MVCITVHNYIRSYPNSTIILYYRHTYVTLVIKLCAYSCYYNIDLVIWSCITGSWCEEEKAFPLKKRRISLERFISTKESSKVDKQKRNRKIAKMWASSGTHEAIYGEERDYNEVEINSDQAIEENLMTRCTKVNGAGWRCSKRRFEGYSLCKHHFKMQRMYNSRRPRFGGSKKRKKVMISSILDRTMPLLDT